MWEIDHLSKPWKEGATGPDEFDCWGFVKFVYLHERKIVLPDYPYQIPFDLLKNARALDQHSNSEDWLKLSMPEPFCVVGMARSRHLRHVGIVSSCGRRIVHAKDEIGVVAETLTQIKSQWPKVTFYRYVRS